jgi:hypothetical protein
MKVNRRLIAMTASLAVVAGTFIASPAMAASHSDNQRHYGTRVTAAQIAAADAAVTQVRSFQSTLTAVDGDIHFDAARALALGARPETVREVATGIVAAGGTVSGVSVDASAVRVAREAVQLSSCVGVNDYSTQWFGHQLKLDSCNTSRLIGALAVGAGAAGIAALITAWTGAGPVVAGVIAGVLTIGGGAIAICAADGDGLILDQGWNGVPWCSGQ